LFLAARGKILQGTRVTSSIHRTFQISGFSDCGKTHILSFRDALRAEESLFSRVSIQERGIPRFARIDCASYSSGNRPAGGFSQFFPKNFRLPLSRYRQE
jgi:hypothetical protein